MSKKLGLENKYKQFINPTQLGKYKAVMGKIKNESGKLKDLRSSSFFKRAMTLRAGPIVKQAASSVLKRSPVGKVVSAVGKAFMSKPGFFGAGVGIGSSVKKDNKKMGGGMMQKPMGYDKGGYHRMPNGKLMKDSDMKKKMGGGMMKKPMGYDKGGEIKKVGKNKLSAQKNFETERYREV